MTKDEFLKRYHHYHVLGELEARGEAVYANDEGVDGGSAVAVHFPGIGWGLMLLGAVGFMRTINPGDPTWQEAIDGLKK